MHLVPSTRNFVPATRYSNRNRKVAFLISYILVTMAGISSILVVY